MTTVPSPLIQKLGLGTVQFGMHYGNFNQAGQPTLQHVSDILKHAYRAGIQTLDTAYLYGDSESVLGQCLAAETPFRIVTKTPYFNTLQSGQEAMSTLARSFEESLHRLNRDAAYGLLLHHCDDLLGPFGDALFAVLQARKEEGRVSKIGVSIYTADQIEQVLSRFPIDLIQVPLNVFDQRLVQSGLLRRLNEAGVEIHARSVFLQGLLLADPQALPAHLQEAREPLARFQQAAAQQGLTPLQAALQFALQLKEIGVVLVGVDSVDQLTQIVAHPALSSPVDFAAFQVNDERILNPALWKR